MNALGLFEACGLIVRVFRSGISSFEYETSDSAARSIQCATVILKDIPVRLANNRASAEYKGRIGFIYNPFTTKVSRAFKKDIYSSSVDDKSKVDVVERKGKERVVITSKYGHYGEHRDYGSFDGITEKVRRMHSKHGGILPHNEVWITGDEVPLQDRVIGVLIDEAVLSNLDYHRDVLDVVLSTLPGVDCYFYSEGHGSLTKLPIQVLKESFFYERILECLGQTGEKDKRLENLFMACIETSKAEDDSFMGNIEALILEVMIQAFSDVKQESKLWSSLQTRLRFELLTEVFFPIGEEDIASEADKSTFVSRLSGFVGKYIPSWLNPFSKGRVTWTYPKARFDDIVEPPTSLPSIARNTLGHMRARL